jgi:hypothetical protein
MDLLRVSIPPLRYIINSPSLLLSTSAVQGSYTHYYEPFYRSIMSKTCLLFIHFLLVLAPSCRVPTSLEDAKTKGQLKRFYRQAPGDYWYQAIKKSEKTSYVYLSPKQVQTLRIPVIYQHQQVQQSNIYDILDSALYPTKLRPTRWFDSVICAPITRNETFDSTFFQTKYITSSPRSLIPNPFYGITTTSDLYKALRTKYPSVDKSFKYPLDDSAVKSFKYPVFDSNVADLVPKYILYRHLYSIMSSPDESKVYDNLLAQYTKVQYTVRGTKDAKSIARTILEASGETILHITLPISKPSGLSYIDSKNQGINLDSLSVDDFGKMLVFDVFVKDNCMHGNKVLDVVRQTLASYNIKKDVFSEKVDSLPINYFSNMQFGDRILNDWTNLTNDLPVSIDSSVKKKYLNNNDVTHAYYMTALYTVYCSKGPSVVTGSYLVPSSTCYIQSSTPYTAVDSNTNFFTAASNDSEDIDRYKRARARNGEGIRPIQPITDFSGLQSQLATVIVGNRVSPGRFLGGFSQTADIVTALGRGVSWGSMTGFEPHCINFSDDIGTSFATPEIATQLFIAKAFWVRNNIRVPPMEARNRLLLASDVELPFIAKFSSAGPVNMRKLLQLGSAYLVTNEDSIIPVSRVYASFITSPSGQTQPNFTPIKSKMTDNVKSVRGIYCVEGHFYVWYNDPEIYRWEILPEPFTLNLVLCTSKSCAEPPLELSSDSFKQKYKQFVILNSSP